MSPPTPNSAEPNPVDALRAGLPDTAGLYQLLVERVRDYAIVLLDVEGRIASWNTGAERIKGYREEEVIGRHLSIFYTPEDAASGKLDRALALAASQGSVEDEGWRVRGDGSRFWANTVLTALRDRTGELVGYAKVTRDLTERREAEARAVADAARIAHAEAASRAKSEFLSAMSHELRTPLNAIGGYAELLALGVPGPVTEAQLEYLARIQRSQRQLLGIITDLLNLSRIESGALHYREEAVPLAELAAAVIPLMAPQALAKGIVLEAADCAEGAVARADRARTEQILVNLVSNAIKFTPRRGNVSLACATDGDTVSLSVRDTGVGIAAGKLETIFEPFVQLGRTLTATYEGAGLGLAISRDLARAMGGDLVAAHGTPAGSVFTLTLPRHRAG